MAGEIVTFEGKTTGWESLPSGSYKGVVARGLYLLVRMEEIKALGEAQLVVAAEKFVEQHQRLGEVLSRGAEVASDLAVGTKVFFPVHSGTEYRVGNEKLYLVHHEAVLARIEEAAGDSR